MTKVKLAPLVFAEINEREKGEYAEQLSRLKEMYGDVADFLETTQVGEPLPQEADAIVFRR